MKRSVFTLFALALTTLVIGCSGGGSGSGKKDDKGNKGGATGGAMPAGATRPDTLARNAWCANNDQDQTQLRLEFSTNGSVAVDQYSLQADGSRGGKLNSVTGTWYVQGGTMTYQLGDGQPQTEAIRLDPMGPAGQPQLVFGTAPQTLAYDPCL